MLVVPKIIDPQLNCLLKGPIYQGCVHSPACHFAKKVSDETKDDMSQKQNKMQRRILHQGLEISSLGEKK